MLLEVYVNLVDFYVETIDLLLPYVSKDPDLNMILIFPDIPHKALFSILGKMIVHAIYNNLDYNYYYN